MASISSVDLLLTARAITSRYNVNVALGDAATASVANHKGEMFITIPQAMAYKADKMPLIRGYLDHECGHVLYTDMSTTSSARWDAFVGELKQMNILHPHMSPSLAFKLHNIFEDFRVEGLMGKMYPGCFLNLKQLNAELFQTFANKAHICEAMPGFSRVFAASSSYLLRKVYEMMYGLNLYSQEVKDEYFPEIGVDQAFDTQLDAIAHDAVQTRNENEVFPLMDRYFRLMLAYSKLESLEEDLERAAQNYVRNNSDDSQQQDQSNDGKGKPQSGSGGSATPTFDSLPGEVQQQLLETARTVNDSRVANACREAVEDENQWGASKDVMIQRALSAAKEKLPSDYSKEDYLMADELNSLQYNSDTWYSHRVMSDEDMKWIATQDAYMRGLFQAVMETVTYRRARTARVGMKLDSNNLHRASLGDGRLFRQRAERLACNTDVCILLDGSCSMDGDPIRQSYKVVLAMTRALRATRNLRAAAYIFADDNFCPLVAWDQPVPKHMAIPHADGSTPLAASLLAAVGQFPLKRDTRKIIFVVSDGDPDSGIAFTKALEIVRGKGIEVYGVALGELTRLRRFIKETVTVTEPGLSDFLPKLRTMMQQALWRGGR